jgi:hypothetical protein
MGVEENQVVLSLLEGQLGGYKGRLGQWPEGLPSLLPTLCNTLYNVPECYDFPFSPTVRS